MKYFFIIIILLLNHNLLALEVGETEITTDEGIEIFQEQKFYLLKKNVKIISSNFKLSADKVKAYFDKDLYDIIKIQSNGNVELTSNKGIKAKGIDIYFSIKDEIIIIKGKNSSLKNLDINMYSDKMIKINNLNGSFKLRGVNSLLINNDLKITGGLIDGKFINIEGANEVTKLYVEDENLANIKTKNINMYGKKADYNKEKDLIELFDDVKIIRENETVTGDYAEINILKESYKVKSDKSLNKVKILLKEKNE